YYFETDKEEYNDIPTGVDISRDYNQASNVSNEPKEWIRWLETPCGRLDEQKGSDRLTANHFRLLPAANLCSTQFNAGDTVFECEG
ncbi:hypothetical protein KSF78_0009514, partial [Schistosoma japonicum]